MWGFYRRTKEHQSARVVDDNWRVKLQMSAIPSAALTGWQQLVRFSSDLFLPSDQFAQRHLGPLPADVQEMCKAQSNSGFRANFYKKIKICCGLFFQMLPGWRGFASDMLEFITTVPTFTAFVLHLLCCRSSVWKIWVSSWRSLVQTSMTNRQKNTQKCERCLQDLLW